MLLDLHEGDLESKDFPKARKFHFRQFWRKLEQANKHGVISPRIIKSETFPAKKMAENVHIEQKQDVEQSKIK